MSPDLRATYRLQLHPGFPFGAAAALAGYLAELGISHLYSSPSLQAAPGSTHGYDIVNPHAANPELGGNEGYQRLHLALKGAGLGQVLDIVPNHMAISGRENAWWWDVLENGQASRYARYFDVDWDPPEARLRNRVLMPILGEHYGRVLENGQVQIARVGGTFTVHYFDHVLPVAPRSLNDLLALAARRCASDELTFLAGAFGQLPPATATDAESVLRRHNDKEVLRQQVADLCARDANVAEAIDAVLREINGEVRALDELLERQNYRLTFWRTAERELDYRRFFDINTLVGLRVEDERVFDDTHSLVLRWLAEGVLDGVRVDHVDGLRDPKSYLERLRSGAPDAWIVVEKILEPGERLPDSWPIAGTTGYDFLNQVGGLFVDPASERALTELYAEFTGQTTDFEILVCEKKLLVLRESLGSDVNRLTALWLDICERNWRMRDYTRHELQDVLREVLASYPVYRSYIRAPEGERHPADVSVTEQAIARARERRPDLDADLFTALEDILLLRSRGELESELVMRFQQLSGPAMAKGAEDTAFYVYNRLISLNEVGGDPARFGVSPDEFHAANGERQAGWPLAMLTTSTHDTKRSEDVRTRISLLSEMPGEWAESVRRWSAHNDQHRTNGCPDRNAEYLYYQTLVGAWPLDTERAAAFMLKAAREAKVFTSWTNQHAHYEEALRVFVERTLDDAEFTSEVERFVATLEIPWRVTSLAQKLLLLTSPGVPDIYQGTELWDLSLVDPDNRRPVEYERRRALLDELRDASPDDIWRRGADGLPKLWVVRQALSVRQRRPDAFGPLSTYTPLSARGQHAHRVVAFARGGEVISVAPRLAVGLRDGWGDTALTLPPGIWRNELTGERIDGGEVALETLLQRFPVALLCKQKDSA